MQSILQTPEWAQFKKSQGFSAKGGPASGWEILTLGEIFIHKRSLPFGRNFLYLPEVSADNISPSEIEELKKITREQKSVFCRLELVDRFSENAYKMIQSFGFVKAFEQVQPKWRQIIDLTKSEEEILAQMKSKGRYNIKIAQRHGVKIEKWPSHSSSHSEHIRSAQYKLREESPADAGSELNSKILLSSRRDQDDTGKILKNFYSLYAETVQREKITGRSIEYFQNMVDSFKETDYLKIYVASDHDEPIAAALISFYDGTASYLYGGSSRSHKEVMAPYLMHWQIMRDAKARGMKSYDLLGRTPLRPEGSAGQAPPLDEKSSWAGITKFKEQFGGEAVEILGSFDFIAQPAAYKIFKIAEKLRRK